MLLRRKSLELLRLKRRMVGDVGKGCFQYLSCFGNGIQHAAGSEAEWERAKIPTFCKGHGHIQPEACLETNKLIALKRTRTGSSWGE